MSKIPLKDQMKNKYFNLKKRIKENKVDDDTERPILLRRLYYLLGQWRSLNKFYIKNKIIRKRFFKNNKPRMVRYQKEYFQAKKKGKK